MTAHHTVIYSIISRFQVNGRQRVFGMRFTLQRESESEKKLTMCIVHKAHESRALHCTQQSIERKKEQGISSLKKTNAKKMSECNSSIYPIWMSAWTSEVQPAMRNYVCKIFCRSHFWRVLFSVSFSLFCRCCWNSSSRRQWNSSACRVNERNAQKKYQRHECVTVTIMTITHGEIPSKCHAQCQQRTRANDRPRLPVSLAHFLITPQFAMSLSSFMLLVHTDQIHSWSWLIDNMTNPFERLTVVVGVITSFVRSFVYSFVCCHFKDFAHCFFFSYLSLSIIH